MSVGLNSSAQIPKAVQKQINDCLVEAGHDIEDGKILHARGLMSTVISMESKVYIKDGVLNKEAYLAKFVEIHEVVMGGGEKSGAMER